MIKTLFYAFFFLITTKLYAQNLPPRILVEGLGLNYPAGITGDVIIKISSASTGFNQQITISSDSQSLLPLIISPTIGSDYKITLSNNSNKQIGYVIGQVGGVCTGKSKAASIGNGTEIQYRNGYDLPIDIGQTAEICNQLTINAHANYQKNCSDGLENYELGGIYITLFRADVNRLKISEEFLNTSRDFYIYKIPNECHNFSGGSRQTKIFINGKEHKQQAENVIWDAYGLRVYRFPEGYFKVGDLIWAEDECGSLRSNSTIVSEDFAYLSIPASGTFQGNGISETDTLSPTVRLETPLRLKQCQPIADIGSHNLSKLRSSLPANYPNYQPYKVGNFYLNGQPIKEIDFKTRANAYRRDVGIINTDGSANHLGGTEDFAFVSKNYFVATPSKSITYEYQHNGFDLIEWDFAHYIVLGENFGFRFIHNNDVILRFMNSLGEIEEQKLFGDFSYARYKITFDGTYIRLYINNVLQKEFKQKVLYTASGGSISSTTNLNLEEKVNFMPTDTGYHYIRAKINKIQIVTQRIYIEPNSPAIYPNQDTVSIFQGQTITLGISETSCQGTPKWSNGSNQFSIQVNPIIDTQYTVSCILPNSCTVYPDRIMVKVLPPVPTVTSSASDSCLGNKISLTANGCTGKLLWSNGLSNQTIQITPTTNQVLYVNCIANNRISPSKYISIKIQ